MPKEGTKTAWSLPIGTIRAQYPGMPTVEPTDGETLEGDDADRASSASVRTVPHHVGQKIESTNALFAKAEEQVDRHQHAIERMTDALGRPRTAYALTALILGWVVLNIAAPHLGAHAVDPPPFQGLQGVTGTVALLMTVAVLTTQSRVTKLVRNRGQLDLQVNLIAEEKIAKLISLVEELRRDLPIVNNRRDTLAESMTKALDVHAVARKLERDDAAED